MRLEDLPRAPTSDQRGMRTGGGTVRAAAVFCFILGLVFAFTSKLGLRRFSTAPNDIGGFRLEGGRHVGNGVGRAESRRTATLCRIRLILFSDGVKMGGCGRAGVESGRLRPPTRRCLTQRSSRTGTAGSGALLQAYDRPRTDTTSRTCSAIRRVYRGTRQENDCSGSVSRPTTSRAWAHQARKVQFPEAGMLSRARQPQPSATTDPEAGAPATGAFNHGTRCVASFEAGSTGDASRAKLDQFVAGFDQRLNGRFTV